MLAVVLDVYDGGKDLIPGWKLKEHAESALAAGGVEGLRRYYEACLSGSDHRVKTTLEGDRRKTLESERARFMAMYLGPAPAVSRDDDPAIAAAAAVRSSDGSGSFGAPEEFEKTRECSLALRPRAAGAKENVVPDPRDSTFTVRPFTS